MKTLSKKRRTTDPAGGVDKEMGKWIEPNNMLETDQNQTLI